MVDIQEVGEQLRVRRRALGMSQIEVAALNRINRVTLSRLENGKLPEIGIRKVITQVRHLLICLERLKSGS